MLETGWIALAQLGGFQRATHLQLLVQALLSGTPATTHRVDISVYLDFDDATPASSTQATISTGAQTGTIGGRRVNKIEHQLVRQQFEAMKIVITSPNTGSPAVPAPRARWSNLALRVGVKPRKSVNTRKF